MPPAPKVKLRKVELVKTHSSDKEQTKARRWCSKETVLFKGGVKVEGKPFESHQETKAGEFTEHTPIFDIFHICTLCRAYTPNICNVCDIRHKYVCL